MKLSDAQSVIGWRGYRRDLYRALDGFQQQARSEVTVEGMTFLVAGFHGEDSAAGSAGCAVRDAILAYLRAEIERAEGTLRALGVTIDEEPNGVRGTFVDHVIAQMRGDDRAKLAEAAQNAAYEAVQTMAREEKRLRR